jgi:MHS family proline/betaine transporter-like MFS transporter
MQIQTSQKIDKHSFWGASIGTMIEYYDASIFIFFLPLFAPTFFPSSNAYHALVQGYVILLVAFIARPLGGLFFGYFGDRYSRRKTLLFTIYGMATATFVMGILPGKDTIGIAALIIILLCKAVQYFCFGGEYSGAGVYIVEHAQKNREGYWSCMLTATTLIASLFSSLVGVVLTLPGMPDNSWRVAFIFGGVVGFLGIFYRKSMRESPNFMPADAKKHTFRNLFKSYPLQLLTTIFIGGVAITPFTTIMAFVNPVMMTQGIITRHELMWLQTLISVTAIIFLFAVSKLTDILRLSLIMRGSLTLKILLAVPLLWGLTHYHMVWIIVGEIIIIGLNETLLGPANAYIKNLFPMHYRYRGTALAFNVGMSLFGGLTPLIDTGLYKLTGYFASVGLWIMLASGLCLFFMYLVSRKKEYGVL